MLTTSKDILWLSLSLVILLIGITSAWGIFYFVMILRDTKAITKSFKKKMALIDQILETVKKKVETTASYLPPLIEASGKIAEKFWDKKTEKKNKKEK
ncbi:MAG TPA: hypothetical protein PKL09_02695 [bacterium]|nr:hypothetical protein [bacterium]HNS34224.1 hypothetical protein [bacterium]HNZ73518.1 hypothetical protein [bacterium]HOH67374.1 hypothetical protein [bacterium]